jgi:hypothetical protein
MILPSGQLDHSCDLTHNLALLGILFHSSPSEFSLSLDYFVAFAVQLIRTTTWIYPNSLDQTAPMESNIPQPQILLGP